MSDPPPANPAGPRIVARPGLESAILASVLRPGRSPLVVLEGARGAGKTTLLGRLAALSAARGWIPVELPIDRLVSTPAELAASAHAAAVRACAAALSSPGPALAELAVELDSSRRAGRGRAATLVDVALSIPSALSRDLGRPVLLVLDEVGEFARLASHAGLRDVVRRVARRLADPDGVAVLAAVSPASRPQPLLEALRVESDGALQRIALSGFGEAEVAELLEAQGGSAHIPGAAAWRHASNGHPLYAAILARRAAGAGSALEALATEMTPPFGALHQECRFDYHLLVERSRGHAAVRAILTLLARESSANLTAVSRHLEVTPPTALDYLSWLLEVELIRRDGPGYVLADPLLGLWMRLNAAQPADILQECARFMSSPREALRPAPAPRGPRPGTIRRPGTQAPRSPGASKPVSPRPRSDQLIEID